MTCCPEASLGSSDFNPTLFASSSSARLPVRISLASGVGIVGTSNPLIHADGEGPLRKGRVKSLLMSCATITNAEFAEFVTATNYTTEAEHLGWSFVFESQLPDYLGQTQSVPNTPWWHRVDGASWQRITGPQCSLIDNLSDHPVVHVSWNDARAYCSWVGGRLPTELEWEHAARGGLGDVRFPWGDVEPDDEQNFLCNIWQGRFPQTNTAKDGYETTAPAVSFEVNGYGLYNMVGNVWEWTADPFRGQYPRSQRDEVVSPPVSKLAKGGSFLCHKSYCYRYRIAARIGNSICSSTTHTGFRVVWDVS